LITSQYNIDILIKLLCRFGHFFIGVFGKTASEFMKLRNKPRIIKFKNMGIYVFESKHSANFTMEKEVRDFYKLALIIKGSGYLEADNLQINLREHQLILIPPNILHRFQDDKHNPLTLVMSCFYEEIFADNRFGEEGFATFRNIFQPLKPFYVGDNFNRVEVMNKYRRMLFEQIHRKQNANTVVWCQLLDLLVFLTRTYQESIKLKPDYANSKKFNEILNYLENNFYKEIKVETLASMANMSYRRFTEYFKKATNQTLVEYVLNLRVEYAKRLLIETENVIYSAFEAGFNDVTHFYRVFKKSTGTSPKQFINSARIDEINSFQN
jgi:AraC-like DNA-binding protein